MKIKRNLLFMMILFPLSNVLYGSTSLPTVVLAKNIFINGDLISKFYDKSDNVTCYIYSPLTMRTSDPFRSDKTFEGNNVGSISCVKM